MRIDNMGFKTLREWLDLFPPKANIKINNFGRTFYWCSKESLLGNIEQELLKSYVCNVDEDDFGCDLCLEVACYELEPYEDRKDKIITYLWERLYLTADNAERMNLVFDDYKEEYEQ